MKKSILLATLCVAFAFTSCKDNAADKVNEENVVSAADRDGQSENYAEMTFEETEFDFGDIQRGDHVEHLFAFKNTGDSPLVIVDAKSSCGCTVPEYTKEKIAPGESGTLLVKFDGSGQNQVNKTITVTANTEKGAERLTIKAFVKSPTDQNATK